MKGARINFGVPNSEYVLLADDDGVAVSLKNQDTDTEYIGGGGGDTNVFIAHLTEAGAFDKTWNEIHNALMQGIPGYLLYINSGGDVAAIYYNFIYSASLEDEGYCVRVYSFDNSSEMLAFCESADDYPFFD